MINFLMRPCKTNPKTKGNIFYLMTRLLSKLGTFLKIIALLSERILAPPVISFTKNCLLPALHLFFPTKRKRMCIKLTENIDIIQQLVFAPDNNPVRSLEISNFQ